MLDSNYYLTNDTHTWVLHYEYRRLNEENKEVTSKNHWYFPTLELCLKKYIDQSLKPCQSVVDLSGKLKHVMNNLKYFSAIKKGPETEPLSSV